VEPSSIAPELLGLIWSRDVVAEELLPNVPGVSSPYMATVGVHEVLFRISKKLIADGRVYPSGASFEEATWQALTCGRGWGQKRAEKKDQHAYDAFIRRLEDLPRDIEACRALDDDAYPFLLLTASFQPGRRVTVTRRGYFATVPSDTESGDVIAILLGMNLPFVLRPLVL
jgi:hypothetical protein